MLFIGATGNYGFFNPLAIVLCLPLLDDDVLPRWHLRWLPEFQSAASHTSSAWGWPRFVVLPVASLILLLTPVPVLLATRVDLALPGPLLRLYKLQNPFHLVNGYGLFTHMTTERPEIVVEGSNDGVEWRPYEFRWKPGDPMRRPQFVQPHMPRLDWQMWFAALGSYRSNSWFLAFCERLLQGSPPVLALLGPNPFPDGPPKYLRATLYDYRFTTPEQHRETGSWWTRRVLRPYTPALMLAPDGRGLTAVRPSR
jgi:hypothetical protein